jgi:cardiolipin synthase
MNVLTAANQLTLLRLVLVPIFVLCMLYSWPGWALTVFAIAGLTDALDGLIARRTGQLTTLGAWLDPMADKLLLVSTFVMLTLPGLNLVNRFPIWLTVLVISRDIAIVLTVAVVNLAVARRTFRPSMLGKAATVIYVFTCGLTLIANYLRVHSLIVTIAIWTSLAVTLASGFDYVFRVTLFRSADVTDRQRVNQPDNRAAG